MTAPEITYFLEIDTDRDGTYDNALDDVSAYVTDVEWSNGMNAPYQEVAPVNTMRFTLANQDSRFNFLDSGNDYYGKLAVGTLCRVGFKRGETWTQQLWEGRILSIEMPLDAEEQTITVRCVDLMDELARYKAEPELALRERVDTALISVFDPGQVAYPYRHSYAMLDNPATQLDDTTLMEIEPLGLTEFETAISEIPVLGALPGAAAAEMNSIAFIRMVMEQEVAGRFWFDGRTHKFKFYSRWHDLNRSDTADVDLSTDSVTVPSIKFGDDIVNRITVTYQPMASGDEKVLWVSAEVPFDLAPGQVKRIKARFRDPDNPDAQVTAEKVYPLRKGIDIYTANGNDAYLNAGLSHSPQGATIEFTNARTDGRSITVDYIQVRGIATVAYDKEEVTNQDADSMVAYGLRERTFNTKLQTSDLAIGKTNMLLERFKEPTARLDMVEIPVIDTTLAEVVRDTTVGDLIELTDSATAFTGKFMVVGERHQLQQGASQHMARYQLRPYQRVFGAILDDGDELDDAESILLF
jgi:hypothetical protein